MIWLVLIGIACLIAILIIVPAEPLVNAENRQVPDITAIVFGYYPKVTAEEMRAYHASPRIRYIDSTEPYQVDERTVAIVINGRDDPELLQFDKILGLSWEPANTLGRQFLTPQFQKFVQDYFTAYFVSSLDHINPSYTKFIARYQFHPVNLPVIHEPLTFDQWRNKPHLVSIAVSPKKYLPGHQYRHALCREIVKRNLPIHIYGGGSDEYKGKGYRGPFRDIEPYQDYRFHIAIENSQEDYYVSEKYLRAVAQHSIPIYLGAPKLADIFGQESAIVLTGRLEHDITLLTDILRRPDDFWLDLQTAHRALTTTANLGNAIPQIMDL